MAKLLPTSNAGEVHAAPRAVGLFGSVAYLAGLCSKHVRKITRKLVTSSDEHSSSKTAHKSPLVSPKKLLTTFSNKAMPFLHKKRNSEVAAEIPGEEEFDGFGDGGLWQRDILMGEKCQPLDFSGVIFYDSDGKRVPQLPPRSPRSTPVQGIFSFPVLDKGGN